MKQVFFSDLRFPDQYYAVLIRSTIQRGTLLSITPPELPNGYQIFTASDIPGVNELRAFGNVIQLFASKKISYYGEPLGILVGPDYDTVKGLVAEVLIETETASPFVFSEKFSDQQIIERRIQEEGDIDAVLADSKNIVETKSFTGPQDHFNPEPVGVAVDIGKGQLDIYTPTQWPAHVSSTVSDALQLKTEDIRVIPTSLSDPMDGKIWYPSLLAAQAAIAAVLSKHSVLLVLTRQEDFLFSVKSAPIQIRYRTAIDAEGRIVGMMIRILVDAGAFSPLIKEMADRITVSALGLYAIPAWKIETWILRTNMPPMGALSGWGEPQVLFALESHINRIIGLHNHCPVEWRVSHLRFMNEEYRKLAETVCTSSDFHRKYAAYRHVSQKRKNSKDGPLRGIGIAFGFQGNGFAGVSGEKLQYSVEAMMDTDGDIYFKTVPLSVNMQQIFREITTRILDIDGGHIHFDAAATTVNRGPDTLSNKISILTPLAEKCCESIKRQRFRKPLPIQVKKSWKPAALQADSLRCINENGPFVSLTPAVCVVETEIDPLTYECGITGIWIACNAGELHHKHAVLANIRKSATLALSRILAEYLVIADGKFAIKGGIPYDVYPPSLCPEVHIHIADSKDNPKGIGIIAQNMIPAAFASAVSLITGTPLSSVPLHPEHLYAMLGKTPGEAVK